MNHLLRLTFFSFVLCVCVFAPSRAKAQQSTEEILSLDLFDQRSSTPLPVGVTSRYFRDDHGILNPFIGHWRAHRGAPEVRSLGVQERELSIQGLPFATSCTLTTRSLIRCSMSLLSLVWTQGVSRMAYLRPSRDVEERAPRPRAAALPTRLRAHSDA